MPRANYKSDALNRAMIDKGFGSSALPSHFPRTTENTHPRGGGFQSLGEKRDEINEVIPLNIKDTNIGTFLEAKLDGTNSVNYSGTVLGVQTITLSGEAYLIIAIPRDGGTNWNGALEGPGSGDIDRNTDPLIIDILLMKNSDLEKPSAERKYNLIGSFKAGKKDDVQWTLNNFNSEYNISFHFISTGYSTFLLVYDNSDSSAGVSIQLVDKELTNFAGETEAAFFKQFAPGGDFSNVAEEYGGAFNITSTDNIPVIVSTQDGIFFSESSADVFNRFSQPDKSLEPIGPWLVEEDGKLVDVTSDEYTGSLRGRLTGVLKDLQSRLQSRFASTGGVEAGVQQKPVVYLENFKRFSSLYDEGFSVLTNPVITTTDKHYYSADLSHEQTERFIVKRFRFAFERDFGNDITREAFSIWIPANHLGAREAWGAVGDFELYEQFDQIIIGDQENQATITFSDVELGQRITATETAVYMLTAEDQYNRIIRTYSTDLVENTGAKVTVQVAGISDFTPIDIAAHGTTMYLLGRNNTYDSVQNRTITHYTIYQYPLSSTGDVTPTKVRDLTDYTPQGSSYLVYDGANFYVADRSTVSKYGTTGNKISSFSTSDSDETIKGMSLITTPSQEFLGIARTTSYQTGSNYYGDVIIDVYTKDGKRAVGHILTGGNLDRNLRSNGRLTDLQDIALNSSGIFFTESYWTDNKATITQYGATQQLGLGNESMYVLDAKLSLDVSYHQNSRLFDIKKIKTTEAVSNLKFKGVEIIASKDKVLFQRGTLELEPILFDAKEKEAPVVVGYDTSVFYVEKNQLKYYSQQTNEVQGVRVFSDGINLIHNSAIKAIQDGIFLLRSAGDGGTQAMLVRRAQFGNSYQVNQLATYADLDKYDFVLNRNKVMIHDSPFGAVVFATRKSDNQTVALVFSTQLNNQNQFDDGYSVFTLKLPPTASWESDGAIYFVDTNNLVGKLFVNDNKDIQTKWIGYFDALGAISNTKDFNAFVVEGEIAEGASIDVSIALDNGSHLPVGTITYNDIYPDPTGRIDPDEVGEDPVGTELVGDTGLNTQIKRGNFSKIFQCPATLSSEFITASVRFNGKNGYHSVSNFEYVDVQAHQRNRVY